MNSNHCISINEKYFIYVEGLTCHLFELCIDDIEDNEVKTNLIREINLHNNDPSSIRYHGSSLLKCAPENAKIRDIQISIGETQNQNISIIFDLTIGEKKSSETQVLYVYSAVYFLRYLGFGFLLSDSTPSYQFKTIKLGQNVHTVKWSPYSPYVLSFSQDTSNNHSLSLYFIQEEREIKLIDDCNHHDEIPFCWGDPENIWLKFSLTYLDKDNYIICYHIPQSHKFTTYEKVALSSTLSEKSSKLLSKSIRDNNIEQCKITIDMSETTIKNLFSKESRSIFWLGTEFYVCQNLKGLQSFRFPEIHNWKIDRVSADNISFFTKTKTYKPIHVKPTNNEKSIHNVRFIQCNNRYFFYNDEKKSTVYEFDGSTLHVSANINGLVNNFIGMIPSMNLIVVNIDNSIRFCLFSHGVVAELCRINGEKAYAEITPKDICSCDQRIQKIIDKREELRERQNQLLMQKESIKEFYMDLKKEIPELDEQIHNTIDNINKVLENEENK